MLAALDANTHGDPVPVLTAAAEVFVLVAVLLPCVFLLDVSAGDILAQLHINTSLVTTVSGWFFAAFGRWADPLISLGAAALVALPLVFAVCFLFASSGIAFWMATLVLACYGGGAFVLFKLTRCHSLICETITCESVSLVEGEKDG